jgi:hypothetical protein
MEQSVGVQVPLYPLFNCQLSAENSQLTRSWTLNVTITPLSEVEQEAVFELGPDELQPHFDLAYERFGKARFRSG